MKKYLGIFLTIFMVILYLKGNANPFRYPDADGVVISSPGGNRMSVIISSRGKPVEVVPLELIDAVTIECTQKSL
ncbi:MAG: hypothetical protein AB1427_19555 [Thermodesulfobacteriota bacterium]